MRAWLYDTLHDAVDLTGYYETDLAKKIIVRPRESLLTGVVLRPFLIYGLGQNSPEELGEDTDHLAERQFFQVWVHDEGGDYGRIDEIVGIVKGLLINAKNPPSNVTMVKYLETSQEFSDQTMETIFRYIRFQAVRSEGVRQ